MILTRAYKTELDPNAAQRHRLVEHAHAARAVYNWGLGRKIEEYKRTGKSPSAMDLHKDLVTLKHLPKEGGGKPWLKDVSKSTAQEALRALDSAYKNFFRRCKEGAVRKGFPRFKSRHRGELKFRLAGSDVKTSTIQVCDGAIVLPVIGRVKLKERGYIPQQRYVTCSISECAGRWFVSVIVQVEAPDPKPLPNDVPLGVDVGVAKLATLSDGTVFENPRALRAAERRLAHAQRNLNRKEKSSNNRAKAKQRLAKIYYHVSCIRKDAIHKSTSRLIAKAPTSIGIESLNVNGMAKNRKLAKSVSDASMSEFLRQVRYKALWAGIPVVEADRWFPSTKTCSGCGAAQEMPLGERTYRCAVCGIIIDRDLNAARNLRVLAAGYAVDACGGDVSPSRTYVLEAAPSKQEFKDAHLCASKK